MIIHVINLLNIQEEADVTSIQYINVTNDISMNDDENYIPKYSAQFLPSKNHEDVSSGSEYDPAKRRVRHNKNIILDLLLNKLKIFLMAGMIVIFVINYKKLSSHMAQISESINY